MSKKRQLLVEMIEFQVVFFKWTQCFCSEGVLIKRGRCLCGLRGSVCLAFCEGMNSI